MECVDAIKYNKQITLMKDYLYKQSLRDYLFFVMGINTGIRINEMLQIKVKEVLEENGHIKEYYNSGPEDQFIYLNKNVQLAIIAYIKAENLKHEDFLFKSRKSNMPISRQQAYRIINNSANEVGITGKIGTHTLRKTYGYHAYKKGIAISLLQRVFNHKTPAETYRYIGIDKNEIRKLKIDVNL